MGLETYNFIILKKGIRRFFFHLPHSDSYISGLLRRCLKVIVARDFSGYCDGTVGHQMVDQHHKNTVKSFDLS